MKVYELLELLEDLPEDAEIKLAEQPSWPFEYSISGVDIVEDTVYIIEGEQLGYLPKFVKDEIGWGE